MPCDPPLDIVMPPHSAEGRSMRLSITGGSVEAGWWGPGPDDAPTLVLLHEGLGCVGLWRDVPALLAARTGWGVFAWSRLGYGRSDQAVLPRPMNYLEDEARGPLPQVLAAAGVRRALLVGHSDGGSIAAVYAGDRGFSPQASGGKAASGRACAHQDAKARGDGAAVVLSSRPEAAGVTLGPEAGETASDGTGTDGFGSSRGLPQPDAPILLGLVTIAAHYFVEELNITSIRQIKAAYEAGDLRARLSRWHRDPDMAFYGWNDAWLDPRFRALDLTPYLPHIAVPVLGLQGEDDPYGTDAQLRVMETHIRAPLATSLIPGARHSPHLEAKEATVDAITCFVQEISQGIYSSGTRS